MTIVRWGHVCCRAWSSSARARGRNQFTKTIGPSSPRHETRCCCSCYKLLIEAKRWRLECWLILSAPVSCNYLTEELRRQETTWRHRTLPTDSRRQMVRGPSSCPAPAQLLHLPRPRAEDNYGLLSPLSTPTTSNEQMRTQSSYWASQLYTVTQIYLQRRGLKFCMYRNIICEKESWPFFCTSFYSGYPGIPPCPLHAVWGYLWVVLSSLNFRVHTNI